MISKRFHQWWLFQCPDAVMSCSVLKCLDEELLAFGGHDKTLYLMNEELMIIDDVVFDGWCRCTYPIDIDGDGCDDLIVGTGDDRLLVLKFDNEKQKLNGIMNFKSEGKITCCVGGDLYQDGNVEIIFGGENKKLIILKDVYSKKPIETFYYDSWVTCCEIGFIKLPKITTPVCVLLVGTKNGNLQMIQIKNNNPEILWQNNTYSQINDIKIGDVTNDGYNEIVVASDDSYIKIYDSEGKRLRFIKIEKEKSTVKSKRKKFLNRPVSLLIQDIDGDKANEIVTGCADGTLRIFHNQKLDSKNFEIKWKIKTSSSIKGLCSFTDKNQKIAHIIFGGYERTLRNISDFEWGKKPVLKIPKRFNIPKIPIKKLILEDGKEEPKIIPTSLRGFIVKSLEKSGFYLTTELLINDLMDKGYERKQIEKELEVMKSKDMLKYGNIDFQVWSINDAVIEELLNSDNFRLNEEERKKPTLVEKSALEKNKPPKEK